MQNGVMASGIRIILLASILAACLSGCGEAHPIEARRYAEAAEEILVARNICASAQECRRKEILFWEGGNPWLPGYDKAFVLLYGTDDAALVDAIIARLKEIRHERGMPQARLVVYRSRHLQPKVVFREVSIE